MKSTICFLMLTSVMVLAESKYEKELVKLQELRQEVRDQLKEKNSEVEKNYLEAKELSIKLMDIAVEEYPKMSSLKSEEKWQELWKEFAKKQDTLRQSNKDFESIWIKRAAVYERQGKLLRELSPEFQAQSKLVWELKQAQ